MKKIKDFFNKLFQNSSSFTCLALGHSWFLQSAKASSNGIIKYWSCDMCPKTKEEFLKGANIKDIWK